MEGKGLDSVKLTPEEERMLIDIQQHLPKHILDLPETERRRFLVGHILTVRRQSMEEKEYYERLKAFKPKKGELYELKNWAFDERFNRILEDIKKGEKSIKEIKDVEEVAPGVFRMPMVDEKFARSLLEEVAHFEHWCKTNKVSVSRPNSMNNYGAILDHFGFRKALQELQTSFVEPLALKMFSHMSPLDGDHHGFVVSYQKGKDTKLDFHRDDSEVTLNLCLGYEFTGGDLYFGGVRCQQHQQKPPSTVEEQHVKHEVGYGLIHLGANRHAATRISSGHRENLILWCRSETYRKASTDYTCGGWCGVRSVKENEDYWLEFYQKKQNA